jgi:hypothetical protein
MQRKSIARAQGGNAADKAVRGRAIARKQGLKADIAARRVIPTFQRHIGLIYADGFGHIFAPIAALNLVPSVEKHSANAAFRARSAANLRRETAWPV